MRNDCTHAILFYLISSSSLGAWQKKGKAGRRPCIFREDLIRNSFPVSPFFLFFAKIFAEKTSPEEISYPFLPSPSLPALPAENISGAHMYQPALSTPSRQRRGDIMRKCPRAAFSRLLFSAEGGGGSVIKVTTKEKREPFSLFSPAAKFRGVRERKVNVERQKKGQKEDGNGEEKTYRGRT